MSSLYQWYGTDYEKWKDEIAMLEIATKEQKTAELSATSIAISCRSWQSAKRQAKSPGKHTDTTERLPACLRTCLSRF